MFEPSQPTYREVSVFEQAPSRADFITKVYGHLLGAILLFIAIEAFLFSSGLADQIARILSVGQLGWLAVLGGFMLVGWIATHTAHSAASKGAQYAALVGYVAAEAIIFVPLLWYANARFQNVILPAALVTAGGFTALSAVVLISRKDFSFLRTILIWGGIASIALIACGAIFGFNLGTIFVVAMIALAGAAVLYDTSNVLHHYSEDRYVGAALQLFASIALMFWYVLRLFMRKD
jgi:FtsH-binding integral membrane protein